MSDLHKFLQDWLDAATGKVAKPTWYDGHWSLCSCARVWDTRQSHPGAEAEIQHRLKEEFGETCNYPFGGSVRFYWEMRDGTMHKNPERLAWVRKVLAEEADPVWGAAIDVEVVCERPDWLKASDICNIRDRGIWTGTYDRLKASEWFWHKDVTQIKLLADHAYYTVQAHNKARGTSYTYWGGQGDTPYDWDGFRVMLRNGSTSRKPTSWSHPWREDSDGRADVIGYTRKVVEARDDLKDFLTEWLECATTDREGPLWFSRKLGLCHCARNWDRSTGRDAYGPLSEKMRADFPKEPDFPFGGVDRFLEDKAAEVAHQNPERLAWVRKTRGLTPPAEDAVAAGDTGDAYGALRGILDEAYNQSAKGKGLERHGNGRAWTEQPILAITRDTGIGFPTGQAIKKVTEAVGMLGRGEGDAAARELLGAIVYTAAAIHFIREGSAS